MAVLKVHTRVLPGHRIEFSSPELPEGQEVEVEVRSQTTLPAPGDHFDILELAKLPPEKRRPYLEAAARKMVDLYKEGDPERDAWQSGDIIEY